MEQTSTDSKRYFFINNTFYVVINLRNLLRTRQLNPWKGAGLPMDNQKSLPLHSPVVRAVPAPSIGNELPKIGKQADLLSILTYCIS
jgi:hypothetical protein